MPQFSTNMYSYMCKMQFHKNNTFVCMNSRIAAWKNFHEIFHSGCLSEAILLMDLLKLHFLFELFIIYVSYFIGNMHISK